jgi:hypothetical protein
LPRFQTLDDEFDKLENKVDKLEIKLEDKFDKVEKDIVDIKETQEYHSDQLESINRRLNVEINRKDVLRACLKTISGS